MQSQWETSAHSVKLQLSTKCETFREEETNTEWKQRRKRQYRTCSQEFYSLSILSDSFGLSEKNIKNSKNCDTSLNIWDK